MTQLTLFQEPNAALVGAINKLANAHLDAPSYTKFINELAALMVTQRPGSVILAAVPNGFATRNICESIQDYFDAAKKHPTASSEIEIATLEIPHTQNIRAQHKQLANIYSSLSFLSHSRRPQFELDFPEGFSRPDPLQQICGTIKSRFISHYLVRNAHYLSPSGSPVCSGVNQLRFFAQLAAQSEKTHVLFTNASKVCDWLSDAEIASEFSVSWLRPYIKKNKNSFWEFQGILKSYDSILPRDPDFKLLKHADDVIEVVSGCPYRLNKWLIAALTLAQSTGAASLNWQDLCNTQPTLFERKHALLEAKKIYLNCSAFGAPTHNTTPKSDLKPGQSALGRDDVPQSDESAA
jgi:hypothetical protein